MLAERANQGLVQAMAVLETAHRLLQDLNDGVGAAVGLTLNQVLVLSEIAGADGKATVSTLAATLGRAVHTLTSAVNGLERKSLVSRRTIRGEDRRIVRIAATSAGAEALATFKRSLDPVLAVLSGQQPQAGPPVGSERSVEAMVRLFSR